MAARRVRRRPFQHPLIHFAWRRADPAVPRLAPLAGGRPCRRARPAEPRRDVGSELPRGDACLDAVLAGQGIAILSDVVVAAELASERLVKVHDLGVPGFSYHLVHLPDHPRRRAIATFSAGVRSVA